MTFEAALVSKICSKRGLLETSTANKQPYNSGIQEIFSNFAKDPCLPRSCRRACPVGFTCIRAVPPRSGELRLDLSGCNLKCPFCWTISKPHLWSPAEILEAIRCRFRQYYVSNLDVGITYLRITGGEPILGHVRAHHLLDLFRLIDEDVAESEFYSIWKTRRSPFNLMGRKNIKIQTNGVMLPKLLDVLIERLVDFKNISFTFEVSLKGTTPQEFQILSGGLDSRMFFEQLRAIEALVEYENVGYPIFARCVLGVFHSDQYDLVFPRSTMRMMLSPHAGLIRIVGELRAMSRPQERIYVEPLRFTDQMGETRRNCADMGIIAKSEVGQTTRSGKKTLMSKTYLWDVVAP